MVCNCNINIQLLLLLNNFDLLLCQADEKKSSKQKPIPYVYESYFIETFDKFQHIHMVLRYIGQCSHGPFSLRFNLSLSLLAIFDHTCGTMKCYTKHVWTCFWHVFTMLLFILHAYHYHDLCNCMHFFWKNSDYNDLINDNNNKMNLVLNFFSTSMFCCVLFFVQFKQCKNHLIYVPNLQNDSSMLIHISTGFVVVLLCSLFPFLQYIVEYHLLIA